MIKGVGWTTELELLEILKEDPYHGRDDTKKLQLPDYDLFRMHVGQSFTIFYRIYEAEKVVKV